MTTSKEVFTITIARAIKPWRGGLRRVPRRMHDAVLQRFLARCWEQRDTFDPAQTTLEHWCKHHLRVVVRASMTGFRTIEPTDSAFFHDGALDRETAAVSARSPYVTSDSDMRSRAPIDHEIERLLRRPQHTRADCPVCWRCSYFMGLTPRSYHTPRFADPEMQEAVRNIEARKIRIGKGERL